MFKDYALITLLKLIKSSCAAEDSPNTQPVACLFDKLNVAISKLTRGKFLFTYFKQFYRCQINQIHHYQGLYPIKASQTQVVYSTKIQMLT